MHSGATEADFTIADTDEPVLVAQAAVGLAPEEFTLPKAPAHERPRWYGSTEVVEVHGLRIPGLVRVALGPPPKGMHLHAATIAAWMTVELGGSHWDVEPIYDASTAPSFTSLTEAQRGLYLKWLAAGRSFEVPPRLALLFVFGLESMVTGDKLLSLPEEERRSMAQAARDLVSRFGSASPQLRLYGLSLAGFLEASAAPNRIYMSPVPDLPESRETPALVQVAIGQAARDGAPLPAEWALAKVLPDVCVLKRASVGRCAEELRELSALRFDEHYPNGMKVRRSSSSTLTIQYFGIPDPRTGRSAGATVSVPSAVQASLTDSQTAALKQIVDKCSEELSTYSRFIGRMPAAKGMPDADVRLPSVLLRRRLAARLTSLGGGSAKQKSVSLEEAWTVLWGVQAERKDSEPFLRAFLASEGFTVVAAAQARKGKVGKPAPPAPSFWLDPVKLERVRRDDAASTTLLSALFADKAEHEPYASPRTAHVDPARALLPQLDDEHFQFLTRLLNADTWNRERLEQAASQLGLMLDGALELTNDAAFELSGGPLVVDEGDLQVDSAVAQDIRTAMAAARQTAGVHRAGGQGG